MSVVEFDLLYFSSDAELEAERAHDGLEMEFRSSYVALVNI